MCIVRTQLAVIISDLIFILFEELVLTLVVPQIQILSEDHEAEDRKHDADSRTGKDIGRMVLVILDAGQGCEYG